MGKKCVATIFALNYYNKAITMIESVKRHNPEYDINVLISDKIDNKIMILNDFSRYDVNLTFLDDLKISNIDSLAFKYDMVEFCTCVKPGFISLLFEKYEKVIYLDPDIMVYSDFMELEGLLDHNSIVLTPHISDPSEEGISPATDFLRNGIYNLGFIALRNDDESNRFLSWWNDKLMDYCFCDSRKSLAWDQKWIDFAPALFKNVYVLRKPNYNMAFWNMANRVISEKEGEIYVNNDYKLVFFHFSHFSIHNTKYIFYINKDINLLTEDRADMKKIVNLYANAVKKNTKEKYINHKYNFNYYDNGELVKEEHRKLYHHLGVDSDEYKDPFNTKKVKSFYNIAKMFEDINVSAL